MLETETESQDTEITLGTGKLLGLFVALVVVCALFFGFGFSMGRNTAHPTGTTLTLTDSGTIVGPSSGAPKPNASTVAVVAPPTDQTAPTAAVPDASTTKPADQQPAVTPVASTTTAPVTSAPVAAGGQPAPELSNPAPVLGSGYVVQVAAVSKEEDAEALVGALRKKSYPVFLAPSSNQDKLFHVQIGPFADAKEAESMKTRLAGDGYNAIVKR